MDLLMSCMHRVSAIEIVPKTVGYDRHEHVWFIEDPRARLRAFIAVHDTTQGPAVGGCRMYPYGSLVDALEDVLRLSRAMTFKNALLDLPFGGGKAVIIGRPERDKTPDLLRAMAHGVHALGGIYRTCDDMGTSVMDMEVMRTVTPFALGLPDKTGEACPATAWGVVQAMRAVVEHLGGSSLAGLRVGVQGLGKVGMRLCAYLAEASAELVVTDLQPELTAEAEVRFGARVVAPDEILSARVDVLSPCAVGGVLNDKTIPTLRCRAIVAAANDVLSDVSHAETLASRGILYVPDYASNVGGMIDIAHEGPGYDPEVVLADCERIYRVVSEILARSEADHITPSVAALDIVCARVLRENGT